MEQNKTGKYFKYAIGEIVLVVIGILIALQINNWNNNRIAKKIEINQIKQLLEDAKADSIFFESRANYLKDTDSLQSMVLSMYDSILVDSISELKQIERVQLFGTRLANQSNVVINNTDALDIIKNDSIKKQLKKYYAKYEYVSTAIELSNRMLEEHAIPLFLKYSDDYKQLQSDNLMVSYLHLIRHQEIKPNIELSKSFQLNALNQVTQFNEQIADFIKNLEAYLNEKNKYN